MTFKRLTSVLLSAFVLFSSFSYEVFAKTTEEKASDKYIHTVGLLTSLGVIEDVDAYGRAESFVTRGEFAQFITKLNNADIESLPNNAGFSDVDNELAPYASYAYNMGLMRSKGSRFVPESYVTADEAIYALVNMLGYGKRAELEGGDSGAYSRVADSINLTSGVHFYVKDRRVPLKYILQMFYNTLTENILEISSYGNRLTYEATESFLKEKFDVYYTEGRITANSITTFEGNIADDDHVMIEGIEYAAGDSDASQYVGYYVKAYYIENDSVDKTLVYVDYNSECDEITFLSTDATFSDRRYMYKDVETGKEKKAKIALDAILILNDVYTAYSDEIMLPDEGSIKLVNTDGDNEYEVVVITSATIGVVNSYNTLNKQLSLKMIDENGIVIDRLYDLSVYDDENVIFLDFNSRELTGAAVTDGIVVTIYDNGTNIKIVIGGKTVSGAADTLDGDSISIDGEKYDLSPLYIAENGTTPVLGVYGMYYLNTNGRVISFKIADSEWKYAYLLKGAVDKDIDYTTCQFNVVTQESLGSVKLQTAKKFRVDGDLCDKQGIRKKDSVDVIATIFNAKQLIRYKVNEEGNITHIDTDESIEAADQPKEGLRVHYDLLNSTTKHQYKGLQFNASVGVKGSAVVLFVPTDAENENDANLYSFGTPNNLKNDNSYNYKAYTLDDDSIAADVLVVKRNFAPESTAKVGVVKKLSKILNEDDEVVEKLYVYTLSGVVSYVSREDNWFTKQKVEVNDTVRVSNDGAGFAAFVELIYDEDEALLNPKTDEYPYNKESSAQTNYGYSTGVGEGYVYSKNDGFVGIKSNPADAAEAMTIFDASNAAVLVCDLTDPQACYKGTISDLMDYKSFGEAAKKDKVILQTRYWKLQTIVIYKQ